MSSPGELFASGASHYARYQPRYPRELFDFLAEAFGLNGTQTALDLGCGPGILALPLSRLVARVIAVDPEPGMLEEGRSIAERQGVDTIRWRRGDSSDLRALGLPPLDLCVMGRSFHWMSREQVLADLDGLVNPEGGVVIVATEPAGTVWSRAVDEVREAYRTLPGGGDDGSRPELEESNREVLRRSLFPRVTAAHWTYRIDRTLDEVIGLQFSHSSFTPARLGGRKDAFERDLRTALAGISPDGRFEQTVRTEALTATRRHRGLRPG
ncbi:class I SAM-dependent methyltransferase [Kitasatospora xanthocidica]|uniref:Class I SAM-dependent methyltransferase n=1 Tax=Kitasatospora xanthocidica TaxID=83382 RepID=A0A372ZQ14_9ACTN|nr:class I SAM-dependent methyltransferase [Kitasatospora xanthocidica]RGD57295.1 class I SAM-dependent methyltransferase [Kitasatospora xanthocidica]